MLKMRKNLVIVTIILMVCLLGAMTLKVQATGIDNPVNLTGDLDIITGGDDLNSTNNTTMWNRKYTSKNRCNRRYNSNVFYCCLRSFSNICL